MQLENEAARLAKMTWLSLVQYAAKHGANHLVVEEVERRDQAATPAPITAEALSDDLLEQLMLLVDKCDNNLMAATLPVSAQIHAKGLLNCVREVRADLSALVALLGGEGAGDGTR